jgi:hypothetical protein
MRISTNSFRDDAEAAHRLLRQPAPLAAQQKPLPKERLSLCVLCKRISALTR